MGRKPTVRRTDPFDPLRMRITMTETGYPAPPEVVGEMFVNPHACSSGPRGTNRAGWWWVFATPASHASIARHGHLAVGSLTTSFAPPDDPRPGEWVPAFAGGQRACACCGSPWPCEAHPGAPGPAGGPRESHRAAR